MNPLRLLLIDDDMIDRKAVRRALARAEPAWQLVEAVGGEEGLQLLAEGPPFDCILLDYRLPGGDGLTLLAELVSDQASAPPVIMLTGEGNEMVAVEAMKRGAADYLPKSLLTPDALFRAVRQAVEQAELRRALANAQAQLEHMALYDALSGLGNRALFMRDLGYRLAEARRHGGAFGLLLMDLDRFKAANDTWGHQCGDFLLTEVGRRLIEAARANDLFYRLGGDEFTALVDGADAAAVWPLAERIRARIAEPYQFAGQVINLGISIGMAFFPAAGGSGDLLIRAADGAMYQAKRGGAGIVCASAAGQP